jgi:hypothetical protein
VSVVRDIVSDYGIQVGLKAFHVKNGQFLTVDTNEPLRLEPRDIAGDQFADCADLRGQFLVGRAQGDGGTTVRRAAFGFNPAQNPRNQTVPDSGFTASFASATIAGKLAARFLRPFRKLSAALVTALL